VTFPVVRLHAESYWRFCALLAELRAEDADPDLVTFVEAALRARRELMEAA